MGKHEALSKPFFNEIPESRTVSKADSFSDKVEFLKLSVSI